MDTKFDGADVPGAPLPAFDDQPTDRRAVRALVAGAAGVAVLAGACVGFIWLSSAPQADASALAVPGAISTPSVTSTPSSGTSAFGFTGRDIFDNTVAPNAGAGGGTSADGVSVAGTSASTASAVSGGGTGTGSSGGSGSSGSGTGPASPGPTTTGPSTSAPSTATPSKSSAPGWTVPQVKFVSGSAAAGVFQVGGEFRTVARGDLIYPLSVRYMGIVVEEKTTPTATPTATSTATPTEEPPTVMGIFVTENDSRTGWLVPSDVDDPKALPAAARGDVTGRARSYGVLDDKFWIRIDRGQGKLYEVDSAVDDTPLTFTGRSNEEYGSGVSADLFFKDGDDVVYFGTFGARESDGVLF